MGGGERGAEGSIAGHSERLLLLVEYQEAT